MVQEVLRKVQTFEPVGVGARDLAECLRLQAGAQGIYEGLVASLIDKYLPQVAESQLREIAAAENVSPEDVQLAVDILKTLNPKPGSVYGTENASYITPDVTIEKVDDSYVVRLNDSYVPKLHITNLYRQAADFDADTQKYIKKRLTAASWLINSIEQRRETIRKVVEEIVRVQKDFLDKGQAFLKPLSMKEVAEAIEVHESTVSRAVANKYAEIPGGVVSLKSFFQTGLGKGSSSEDFLASQAKAELAALIKAEDPKKPLSDQKLCELLKEKKMDISRRTVMKYREQLGYPSSVKRKRY
jgi:RNA polymerase sigma-54 factor